MQRVESCVLHTLLGYCIFHPVFMRNGKLTRYLSHLWHCRTRTMASRTICLGVDGLDRKDVAEKVAMGVQSLEAGHVIAVPTDTIYGVAGLAQNSNAVKEIYNIKNRNFRNPIAICVGDIKDIYRWSKVTVSENVLSDLLPGPVTVVMQRNKELNPDLNPNTDLVGLRIPDNDFIRALCQNCKGPVALTSANSSGSQSTLAIQGEDRIGKRSVTDPFPSELHPTSYEFQHLWPKLDLIFDGGRLSDTDKARLGSTVVDLSEAGKFRIIREGSAYQATVDLLRNKYKFEEILKIL